MTDINRWLREKKNYEDEEVTLDEINIPNISNALRDELKRFINILKISFVDCGLTSLENFPSLPGLIELDLSNNRLTGNELSRLPNFENIELISLANNQIRSVRDLAPLIKYKETLLELELEGCPLAEQVNYRNEVFELIGGSLESVDYIDIDGNRVTVAANEEGSQDEDDDQDDENEEGGARNGEENQDDDDDEEDDDDESEDDEDYDDDDGDDDEDEEEDLDEESEEPAPKNNKRQKK